MKNKLKKIDFTKLLSNRSFVIPLSIICAFVMWIVIVVRQNPVREQVFTDVSAAISVENTAASEMGLGIVSDLSDYKFTVTVNGPNYIVSSLKTSDFSLTADISNINAAGTYTLNIIANRNSDKSGYSFVSVSPATIDVTFDYIDTKDFTIKPNLIGVSAAEGLVAETPIPSNSDQNTITIKGPRTIMSKIDSVGCVAEVNKTLSSTQSFECYVVLYDKNGDILYRYTLDGKVYNGENTEISDRRLSLSYTSLKITQPISKKKSVSVVPTFSSIPSGFDVNSFGAKVNIGAVNIIGTPDVVEKMTYLELAPIDFKEISVSNNVFEISPDLPEGVKLVDSIEYFTVMLDTGKFTEKIISVSDIKFTNIEKNLSASKNAVIKNVKICVPVEMVNSVNDQDFYAEVDLTGKKSGDYTLDAIIKTNKYSNLWVYGTYSVSITVK